MTETVDIRTAAAEAAEREAGPVVTQDIAMMGQGFYSRVSLGPKAVIDNATSLVLQALEATNHRSTDHPYVVADYGAADGGTSLDLMCAVIDGLRTLNPDRPIAVNYTDLPGADFGMLFRHVERYTRNTAGIHVFASGVSFYRQILPTASVDLGFSASAMHYLSRVPGIIEDHVHAVGATAAEAKIFRAVAQADWQQILLCRAAELAPGGRAVMANFCIDERGYYLGNTGGHNMFDNYADLWRGMRDDGVVTAGEFRGTCFQQFYKSIEDSTRPLTDPTSQVFQSGLRLVSAEVRVVECPFRTAFETGELDVGQFALQFVNTHRSWTETTFRSGLSPTRTDAEISAILDELYHRYRQLVLHDPTGHGKDLLHLYLTVERI